MDLIKERLYYTIGEVSEILDLNASTIRYWEKHFTVLRPSKRTGTSKRKFDLGDVQTLYKIKVLLKVKKFSIKKACLELTEWTENIPFSQFKDLVDEIRTPKLIFNKRKTESVKKSLSEIRNLLSSIR